MLIRCALAGVIAYVFCLVFSVSVTIAAECQQQDNFSNWLEHFRQEATSQGISQQTIVSALNGISYDPAIIARDHSQNVFQQSFGQFSGRMVSPDRLRKGANMLKRYGSILERIEARLAMRTGTATKPRSGPSFPRQPMPIRPVVLAKEASIVLRPKKERHNHNL